jgi:hypothetical protein
MTRRPWTTDELREMEKQLAKPPPYPPFLIDNLRAALVYAADLIDAADAAISQAGKLSTSMYV